MSGRLHMVKRLFKLLLTLLILSASQIPAHSLAGNVSEYKIKVAFIYNFARFTEWPDDTKELKICVYGKDPFDSYIDSLNGKMVDDKTITIVRTKQIEEVKSCHIAFLNIIPPERYLFERALNKIKGTKVLTIADAANVIKFGVMIGLVIEDDKVGFEVNHTMAKSEQLEISAQLLRLAKDVI